MIKNAYISIGIIYLIMGILYAVTILLIVTTAIYEYLKTNKNSEEDKNETILYKLYLYYSNIRYFIFFILYFILGTIYILSQIHENSKISHN